MDFGFAHLRVIFAAFLLFLISQTSVARSISYYQSGNPLDISDSYLSFNQQQQQLQQYQPQQSESQYQFQQDQRIRNQQTPESTVQQQQHQLGKRRLVVRVPFAQSPDSIQLHRLYKTLFDNNNTKQKKFMSLQALL
uniref:Uncharacterized protein n=1 Tax=Panagrolaimus sp. ES5 TaxID=591445 RepID=A0AC34FL85_9BILA